jgi:ketosteroid isomerase-like protein
VDDNDFLLRDYQRGHSMRAPLTLCCTFVAVASLTVFAAQGLSVESVQETLIRLEKGWNASVYKNDVAFVDKILATEFTATYEDGSRGNRAKELALIGSLNQHVDSAVQDEFTVKTYGDTAVVWFTLHLVGPKQGKQTELTMRYTDVWVLRDGRWQCVSSQSTRVTEK